MRIIKVSSCIKCPYFAEHLMTSKKTYYFCKLDSKNGKEAFKKGNFFDNINKSKKIAKWCKLEKEE